MSIVSVKGFPTQTELELQEWIRTQEAKFGEISRIGNEDGFTMGSFYRFDKAHPRPSIKAKFEKLPETAPARQGELCRGKAYIQNALVHIVVYRPAA
jgi:hypothetical protein